MPGTPKLSSSDEWMRDLTAAREGDVAARNRLITFVWPHLYLLHIANEELRTKDQRHGRGSDLTQECLLTAVQKFQCFPGQTPTDFLLWLRQILLYKLSNFNRYAGWRVRHEVPLDQGTADATAAREYVHLRASFTWVGRLLAQMSPDDQRIIRLRELDELTFKEIGAQLGCSDDTAEKRFVRAFHRLLVNVSPLRADELDEAEKAQHVSRRVQHLSH